MWAGAEVAWPGPGNPPPPLPGFGRVDPLHDPPDQTSLAVEGGVVNGKKPYQRIQCKVPCLLLGSEVSRAAHRSRQDGPVAGGRTRYACLICRKCRGAEGGCEGEKKKLLKGDERGKQQQASPSLPRLTLAPTPRANETRSERRQAHDADTSSPPPSPPFGVDGFLVRSHKGTH